SQFFPLHAGLLEPLDLDEHSSILLETYRGKRDQFNGKLGCYLGRSRIAVLSRALGGRQPCSYSGRCLWGCPSDALYTPSLTLRECQQYPDFEYAAGVYASHFHFRDGGRIDKLVVVNTATGVREEVEVSTLVLAAGCLSTSRIFLQSLHEAGGKNLRLGGLMDNRQILMPWINLKMIGRRYEPRSYQYHQLAFGAVGAGPMDYVHGLITTLKTALVHPIVQSLPFDLGSATRVFRDIHAALGLVNINFSDTRREENYLALESAGKGAPRLVIQYRPEAGEPGRLRSASRRFRKILWKLGCIAPPQMTHIRPMGASVHYAGTIPMAARPGSFECTSGCRSFDFQNLYFADGTTFPALPAKNLTFTLMANAVRVAEQEF
ncbi:MAG: hypothetical protein FJW37_05310, partial [Acidobacteria bacterium]|nr:hypothetical protein [Acidobacteriota bacterium]